MAITILPPAPAAPEYYDESSSDEGQHDREGDVDMVGEGRRSKRAKTLGDDMVTPGEVVTDDPQWMRYESNAMRSPIDQSLIFLP